MKARTESPSPAARARTFHPLAAVLLLLAACSPQQFVPAGGNEVDIQRALDALPDTGGEVRLSAGVYTIRRPVVLRRDGLALRGAGPATLLRLAPRANCPVVILGPSENLPRRKVSRLLLADLTIDGNRLNQQTELWRTQGEGTLIRNNGVTVRSVTDSRVERITVFNCRSGGLVTEHGVRNLSVSGLNSYGHQFDGMACYKTEDSVFTDLHLHHNPGAGLSLDLDFDGNVVADAVMAENDIGIFMRESHFNTFNGIVIRGSRSLGVFLSHAAEKNRRGEWEMQPDTQCDGNTFNGLVIRDGWGAAFSVPEPTCSNTLIAAAQFIGNREGLVVVSPELVVVQGLIERNIDTNAPAEELSDELRHGRRVPGAGEP
jgi:hypothetical protein